MKRKYTEITFTDTVKDAQERYGTRQVAQKMENWKMDDEHLSFTEIAFLQQRDSFYMASVSDSGWPYVQFRGGPPGFLKVLDSTTLAYADFRGNRQYISMGNLQANDRVALFFMDYPHRKRLKIMARTEVFDAEDRPDLVEKVRDQDYSGVIERVIVFRLAAFDWNCPQHITPRFTEEEWARRSKPSETQET
ncbi:MAG: pyridoxamine 5'-phosphate oxidase [Planctomycetota bacterium]|nr:MAG: pyridoxamine 5'-phosphate oxidase [Planctomycetota bacterium]